MFSASLSGLDLNVRKREREKGSNWEEWGHASWFLFKLNASFSAENVVPSFSGKTTAANLIHFTLWTNFHNLFFFMMNDDEQLIIMLSQSWASKISCNGELHLHWNQNLWHRLAQKNKKKWQDDDELVYFVENFPWKAGHKAWCSACYCTDKTFHTRNWHKHKLSSVAMN